VPDNLNVASSGIGPSKDASDVHSASSSAAFFAAFTDSANLAALFKVASLSFYISSSIILSKICDFSITSSI
jgi:hypothetical protein